MVTDPGMQNEPDETLYEVQVWNVDKQEAEWGKLTTGRGLAAVVDEAHAFEAPEDDDLRIVTVGRA